MYCCVESCKVSRSKALRQGLRRTRLHIFPKNPIKSNKWITKVEEWNGKKLNVSVPYICTAHFDESVVHHGGKRTRISLSGVPSKHEVLNNTCKISKIAVKVKRQYHRKPKAHQISETNAVHEKVKTVVARNAMETDSDEHWGSEFNVPVRSISPILPSNENNKSDHPQNTYRVCRFCNQPESLSMQLLEPANYLRILYEDITKLKVRYWVSH